MGETTTLPAPTAAAYDEWLTRRWRLTGALIALMALTTAALMVTMGVRPATYGNLLSDVASSKVDEVQVIGGDIPPEGGTLELRWTVLAGVLDQYAVVQVRPSGRGYDAWQDSVYATDVDPRETLLGINPTVRIVESRAAPGGTSLFEWRAPGPVVVLGMATWIAVLLLLVGGPQPWRATRWAWAWFVLLAGPLGPLAFLLLGGPLGLGRPRDPGRRLTGGWAFLVATFVFGGTFAR